MLELQVILGSSVHSFSCPVLGTMLLETVLEEVQKFQEAVIRICRALIMRGGLVFFPGTMEMRGADKVYCYSIFPSIGKSKSMGHRHLVRGEIFIKSPKPTFSTQNSGHTKQATIGSCRGRINYRQDA